MKILKKQKNFFVSRFQRWHPQADSTKLFLQTFRDKLARFSHKKLSLISLIFMTYLLAYLPTILKRALIQGVTLNIRLGQNLLVACRNKRASLLNACKKV